MPSVTFRVLNKANKWGDRCAVCKKWVAPHAGVLAKVGKTKITLHHRCVPAPPPPPPAPKVTKEVADPTRPLIIPDVPADVWADVLKPLPPTISFDGGKTSKPTAEIVKPFQALGIYWLKRQQRGLLCDDMGMGKTCQSICAVDPFSPLLIVTTASTQRNWAKEIAIWRPDLTPVLVNAKTLRWPKVKEAIIICWSSLPQVKMPKAPIETMIEATRAEIEKAIGPAPFNTTVIYDECHYGKTRPALRSRAAASLGRMALANNGRTWGLTGTPLPNKPPDLYGVLHLIDLGTPIWPTWSHFTRSFNAKKKKDAFGYEWGKPTAAVTSYLRSIMMRRLAEDYLGLPPISFHEITIPRSHLSEEILTECDALIKWAGGEAALEQRLDSLKDDDIANISSTRYSIAAALVPSVLSIARKFVENGIPVAVFSAHRPVIEVLQREPGWVTIQGGDSKDDRYEAVEAFQSGYLKREGSNKLEPIKGIGFTTAGCEGVTLTRAKVLIRASLDWTPGKNEQAVRRLSRIGQESPVEVVDILVDHPLERILHSALRKKELTLRAAGLALRSETKTDRIVVEDD